MILSARTQRTIVLILQIIAFFILALFSFFILLPYTRIRNVLFKFLKIKPHILWAPVPIINIHYNSRADRLRGYKSDCLVYAPFHITQTELFDYNLEGLHKTGVFFELFFIPLIMVWVAFKYDIFQFYLTGGFYYSHPWLVKIEFPFWRLMGKKIITAAYGADARLESVTRKLGKYHAYMDLSHEQVVNEVGQTEDAIKDRITYLIRWSNVCMSMSDMIEYTPGSRNDIFYLAIDTHAWQPIYETNNKEVVILHAPNHPHYKGTRFLLPVIERLKKEGYAIRFVLIQNMTNKEARKAYEQADIIAEQFIIGCYGFFGIESMALGKPVLCYIRKKEYLPDWIECPIVNTNPDNLYENLRKLIEDKDLRISLGKKGRKFVEEVFSLEKVGERFEKLYKEIF